VTTLDGNDKGDFALDSFFVSSASIARSSCLLLALYSPTCGTTLSDV
jgi:hypothetical protein